LAPKPKLVTKRAARKAAQRSFFNMVFSKVVLATKWIMGIGGDYIAGFSYRKVL
jgi:hypothetical protein